MESHDLFIGPAAVCLERNYYAMLLVKLALNTNIKRQATAKAQINYAINGHGQQCSRCKKFLVD